MKGLEHLSSEGGEAERAGAAHPGEDLASLSTGVKLTCEMCCWLKSRVSALFII